MIQLDQKTENKIFEVHALADYLENYRVGKKIVFTNGCFDLIHTGHTRYLRLARRAGDCLVVAINSDDSIRQLKSEKRPIIPLAERMEILAGFYFIDFVTSFEELDPLATIRTLCPDILVKGGDWPIDKVIGKDFIQSRGGEVFTIPEIPGSSTTSIVEKIIHRYM